MSAIFPTEFKPAFHLQPRFFAWAPNSTRQLWMSCKHEYFHFILPPRPSSQLLPLIFRLGKWHRHPLTTWEVFSLPSSHTFNPSHLFYLLIMSPVTPFPFTPSCHYIRSEPHNLFWFLKAHFDWFWCTLTFSQFSPRGDWPFYSFYLDLIMSFCFSKNPSVAFRCY